MQVIKRMHDRKRRQIVRAEISEAADPQLDDRRSEIRPGQQHSHQQNWITICEIACARARSAKQTVQRKCVTARRYRQHDKYVNDWHFVVVKMNEAADQPLIENEKQSG